MCYCTPNRRTPVCAQCAQWLAGENAKLRESLDTLLAQAREEGRNEGKADERVDLSNSLIESFNEGYEKGLEGLLVK